MVESGSQRSGTSTRLIVVALALAVAAGAVLLSDEVESAEPGVAEQAEPADPSVEVAPEPRSAEVEPLVVAPVVPPEPELADPASPEDVLTGTIRRLSDDTPLARWYVKARPGRGSYARLDTDGSFRLEDVLPEATWLNLDAKGSWREYADSFVRNATGSARVRLPERPFEQPLELTADTGWQLEGTVVSEAGGVPPGAWVELGQDYPSRHEVLDAPGNFVLRDVWHDEEQSSVVLRVGAPMHTAVSFTVELPEATRRVRGLELAFGDPDENPLLSQDKQRELDRMGLHVVAMGPPVPLEIHAGEVSRVDLVLPWGAAVEGRVTDGAGSPIRKAEVRVSRLVRYPTPAGATRESMNAMLAELEKDLEERAEIFRMERLIPPFVIEETDAGLGWRWAEFVWGDKSNGKGWFQIGQLPPTDVVLEVLPPKGSDFVGAVRYFALGEEELHELDIVLERQ